MQTLLAGNDCLRPHSISLTQEIDALEVLHSGWAQHVAVWRLSHEATVGRAEAVLARMDALIARLEAR